MIREIYRTVFSEKIRLQFHITLLKLKAIFLRGNRYFCPCCGKGSSKFLRKGNGLEYRENAVCPNCGSLERTRLLYLYFKNETAIFHGSPRILHFAPEYILKKKLIKNPNYKDVDINPNFATLKMDITDIQFPDNYFDYIICSHVLGHIPDEKKALNELFRVLKSDGNLFILSLLDPTMHETLEDTDAITPLQKLHKYGEKDLERLYGEDFSERISTSEIRIEKIDYRINFTEQERQKMSLGDGKREIIYKVVKTSQHCFHLF